MAHGHGHCSCCCGEAAAGSGGDQERGAAWGLYLRIDRQRLQCLNERREGSGALVFRAWEERKDRTQFVESDDDEELLFNIPFTGNVKLKGVIVVGEDDETHPAEMRLFKNIPHMSFDDTGREPDQMFSLNRDPAGELEYPTKLTAMKSPSAITKPRQTQRITSWSRSPPRLTSSPRAAVGSLPKAVV
ncbi:PITH domain-containing protein 1 isoform X2 [Dryobates pubescens]|uniref:PITH domain-containing protein 1 isoform X2 n=1 Tax=Dryobates pubescens TaxID=118200 RepID=UPI0023B8FFA8|nr:PITH domain-containing protein 1 isoform X2 [Dryobates pubescens]